MQGQSPVLTLDYSAKQLAGKLEPVADDQYCRNDSRDAAGRMPLPGTSAPLFRHHPERQATS